MDSEKQCQSNAERQHTYWLKLRKKGLERVEIKLSKESKQPHKKLCRDFDMNRHQLVQLLLDRTAVAKRSAPEWLRSERKLPAGLHASEIPPPVT